MWFNNKGANWICLHCKREFIRGTRGGMFNHVNTIDIEEIREIIIECDIMKIGIVLVLHEYTLRNLLIDLCKYDISTEITRKWNEKN